MKKKYSNIKEVPSDNIILEEEAPDVGALLDKIKGLVWGTVTLTESTEPVFKERILVIRRRIISILKLLARYHPDQKLQKKFKTNAKGLEKYIDVRFNMEGKDCNCKCIPNVNGMSITLKSLLLLEQPNHSHLQKRKLFRCRKSHI